ncbi:class II fructose-bisphosphatase [Paenibacillus sp. UMB4589-SE434]|uniref:class II fructose-bisphosphatase n=1 Tax=Paenibacillus sp. UMB4589-SE434 TaxID=3046314 RepID=UPI00254A3976|nr:class II fructose-bisphosphatase [Paenibacillus sp. UMB4589-SE434]MDK8180004.1 class II fructose-bisphosphatase [Paenibacillus sp. UMB4589-SE434]
MDRQLALEIARVTEAGALASASWIGRGDKHSADHAATSAIREMFDSVPIDGTVVIGEGEMDEAPMLYIGEKVGSRKGPEVDVAVDPLEGTEVVANGLNNGMSVIAIAEKGHFLHAPDMYMRKLAVGPSLAGHLSLDDPIELTLEKAARTLGKSVQDLTVMILQRERHSDLVQALRNNGVRIKLLDHGDVSGAIVSAIPECGVDLYVGSGGAPEGVLAAAALRCLGGELQGRLMVESEEQYARCLRMGIKDPDALLTMTDLVGTGDVIFAATGITNSDLLNGVRHLPGQRVETHSVIMRANTGTIRYLRCVHNMSVKLKYAAGMN